jgi:hypothetical protein
LPEHPGQDLDLRVALIRDLRRHVSDEKRSEDEDGARRWDEKPAGTRGHWRDASWQATPLPAKPTVPKLIPIMTTAREADAVELAQTERDTGLRKRMRFATGSSHLASMSIMAILWLNK